MRQRRDHVGDDDERVAAEDPRQRALVLGLELVVELLLDPGADLLADRLGVHPGGDPLDQPQDQAQVLHVGADRRGDARVLDLDRHLPAVEQGRAVDLADRGRRDRLLVEVLEHVGQALVELLLDHLAHVLEGDRRGGVAQRARACAGTPRGTPRGPGRRRGTTAPARPSSPRPSSSPARRRSARRPRCGGARAPPRVPRAERATLAARVPACRSAWPAARPPIFAVRPTREVGILSFATASGRASLHLGSGDDVVGAVRPADPGLVAAVVVVAEQDQRRVLAQRRARLVALGVERRARSGRTGCARARRRPWSGRCGPDGCGSAAGSFSSLSMIEVLRSA